MLISDAMPKCTKHCHLHVYHLVASSTSALSELEEKPPAPSGRGVDSHMLRGLTLHMKNFSQFFYRFQNICEDVRA